MTPTSTRVIVPFVLALALVAAPPSLARAQSSRGAPQNAQIFEALQLKSGSVVGEIGAGNGELSIAAARVVGTQGKVFASELGDERVKSLEKAVQTSGLAQIALVTGDPHKTNFPDACCDAIFLRNVYHHFADPIAMTRSIAASLKPGGRVAVIDFMPNRNRPEAARPQDRANNESHGVSAESVSRELRQAGLEVVVSQPGDERWFMVVATKPR